jgi:hypothetical protein
MVPSAGRRDASPSASGTLAVREHTYERQQRQRRAEYTRSLRCRQVVRAAGRTAADERACRPSNEPRSTRPRTASRRPRNDQVANTSTPAIATDDVYESNDV